MAARLKRFGVVSEQAKKAARVERLAAAAALILGYCHYFRLMAVFFAGEPGLAAPCTGSGAVVHPDSTIC